MADQVRGENQMTGRESLGVLTAGRASSGTQPRFGNASNETSTRRFQSIVDELRTIIGGLPRLVADRRASFSRPADTSPEEMTTPELDESQHAPTALPLVMREALLRENTSASSPTVGLAAKTLPFVPEVHEASGTRPFSVPAQPDDQQASTVVHESLAARLFGMPLDRELAALSPPLENRSSAPSTSTGFRPTPAGEQSFGNPARDIASAAVGGEASRFNIAALASGMEKNRFEKQARDTRRAADAAEENTRQLEQINRQLEQLPGTTFQ